MPFRDNRLSNAGFGSSLLTGGDASAYGSSVQQTVTPLTGSTGSEGSGTVLLGIKFRVKGKNELSEMQLFMRR